MVDERLLRCDLIFHCKARLACLFLERLLRRLVLFERFLERNHRITLLEYFVDEVVVLLDDALEEIHARQEIGKVLCAKEHIHIGDLPVDVDIAHALSERRTLALVLDLRRRELFLVLLEPCQRLVQLCSACLVLRDRLVRCLVEEAFLLRERVEFAREHLALFPKIFDLGVVAVTLFFKRLCRSRTGCESEDENGGAEPFSHIVHAVTPSRSVSARPTRPPRRSPYRAAR